MISKELLKKVRQIEIRTRHMVNDVFAGHYHSVFKGQGMEFEEVREYQPGDDIRTIDWNVTARTGTPFIKKYVEERELTVMLLVDISASQFFGGSAQTKKELAAEMAAVLAFSAIKNQDRVGLILFSDDVELYVPPNKGTRHVLRVIREVVSFTPTRAKTNPEPALNYLNRVTSRRAVCFLLSDFLFSEWPKKALTATAKRHDMTGVVIQEPLEMKWPKVGLIEWRDAETGDHRLVDTSHPATQRHLQSNHLRRLDKLKSRLRKAGLGTIQVTAGESYERAFINFFRVREHLR